MKYILRSPLFGFTLLLFFLWVGEAFVALTHIPIPGAVVGMVLLFFVLTMRQSLPSALQAASGHLLGNLAMLFVPAAVGAICGVGVVAEWALPLLVSVLGSTLLTLVVTALLMQRWGAKNG